MISYKV